MGVKKQIVKKYKSPINNREYYIGTEMHGAVYEGLPCFSGGEVLLMKGRTFTAKELDAIFDAKLELAANLSEFIEPQKEIGYAPGTMITREELAKKYAGNIREMLLNKGAKEEEKQLEIKLP